MMNAFNSYPNYQTEDFKTFEEKDLKPIKDISENLRKGFIRKVYGIL